MKRLILMAALVCLAEILSAQMRSPSNRLIAMSINGHQFPSPTFSNLMWLSLSSENFFVNELQLFDYPGFDVTENGCPFVNSGNSLPNAKYSIIKCGEGSITLYWIMNNGRRDRNHPSDFLFKDLSAYEFTMSDLYTRIYKIRYHKWYVKITIYKDLSQEIINIKTSSGPID
ncbi:MAG: hypothetical protein ACPGEG_09710 [Salibacteraceae bacterium]